MRARTATLVAALVMTSVAACSGSDDTGASSAPSSPASTGTSSSPDDGVDDGAVDDGVLGLSISSSGTFCFRGDIADYGWFDTQWRAHTDLDSIRFRLKGSTGVSVLGSATTIPPVNFGGRIDYGGLIEWRDKSPLRTDRFIEWSQRDDTDFLTPIEDQTGLLLFHLHFDDKTLAGTQGAALGDLVADYTSSDGRSGSLTLPVDQEFAFGKKAC